MTKKDKSWFILMMIYLMELSNVFVEKGVTKDKRYKNEFVFINMDFFRFT